MGFSTCVLGLASKTTGVLLCFKRGWIFALFLLRSVGNQSHRISTNNHGVYKQYRLSTNQYRLSVKHIQCNSLRLQISCSRDTPLACKDNEVSPREEDGKSVSQSGSPLKIVYKLYYHNRSTWSFQKKFLHLWSKLKRRRRRRSWESFLYFKMIS